MYPERKSKLIFSTSSGKEKEEKRILEVLLEPLYLLKFYSRLYWPWAIYMCVVEIFINKSKGHYGPIFLAFTIMTVCFLSEEARSPPPPP